MTTIVSDGHVVSCDGLSVASGYADSYDEPHMLVDDGWLYCWLGPRQVIQAVLFWIRSGENPDDFLHYGGDDWEMIRICGSQCEYLSYHSPFWVQHDRVFAIGTGAGPALGAQAAGCKPYDCVRIAADIDRLTGGVISEMTIPGKADWPMPDTTPIGPGAKIFSFEPPPSRVPDD